MRSGVIAALALSGATLTLAQSGSVTATGYLTDTHCGRRGATALHIDCAKRNVAAGRAGYQGVPGDWTMLV